MKKGMVVVVKAAVFGSTEALPGAIEVKEHARGIVNLECDQVLGTLTKFHKARFGNRKRNLWRYEYAEPWLGMVTGWAIRMTGESVSSGYEGDSLDGTYDFVSGHLASDKSHKVVMVQPLHTDRWLRPVACLEEDLSVDMRDAEDLLPALKRAGGRRCAKQKMGRRVEIDVAALLAELVSLKFWRSDLQ